MSSAFTAREQSIANQAKADGLEAAARVVLATADNATRVVGTNALKHMAAQMKAAAAKLRGEE